MKSDSKVGVYEACRFRYRTDATASNKSKSARRVARAMLSSCAQLTSHFLRPMTHVDVTYRNTVVITLVYKALVCHDAVFNKPFSWTIY